MVVESNQNDVAAAAVDIPTTTTTNNISHPNIPFIVRFDDGSCLVPHDK